jgi:hypothetical protein
MKSYFVACILSIALFSSLVYSAEEPQGPSKDVPELQALNHWVGKWDSTLTTKPNADLPNGAKAKGHATGEWVHNGRFLRQTWAMEESEGIPKLSGSTMMTYDPRKRVYRSWSFFSNGYTSESQGVWDPKTHTMTWTGRDAESGRTTITKAAFSDEGTETWSIVEKDRDGKIISESTGKNTRHKK